MPHPHEISNERAARIPDSAVEQLVVIGATMEAGQPIDANAVELVQLTFRAIASELLKRRKAMQRMDLPGPDDYLRVINGGAA